MKMSIDRFAPPGIMRIIRVLHIVRKAAFGVVFTLMIAIMGVAFVRTSMRRPQNLTPKDFTQLSVSSWPANNNLIIFGARSVASTNNTDFSGFNGPVYYVRGSTTTSRSQSAVVAFPGGTVGNMAAGEKIAWTLSVDKITVPPVLIDSYTGDSNMNITVTDSQVITSNGVAYQRQSKNSIIASVGMPISGLDTSLWSIWGTAFYQLFPGQYTYTNIYIEWHTSQYVGFYMIFEF